jgi:peptide/nickel transport system substrate-binding protein
MAGIEAFNQHNPTKARALAAEAGYKGEPIRLLTTTQYDYYYNMALVGTEEWKQAGFNIDMQVVDWGTLLSRRNNPALYEMSTVGAPFLAEPSLTFTAGSERPGWWSSEAKDRVVGAFNAETDPVKRAAMFDEVQRLIYSEVPYIKVGDYSVLRAQSRRLRGVTQGAWPYFWNASVEN